MVNRIVPEKRNVTFCSALKCTTMNDGGEEAHNLIFGVPKIYVSFVYVRSVLSSTRVTSFRRTN